VVERRDGDDKKVEEGNDKLGGERRLRRSVKKIREKV